MANLSLANIDNVTIPIKVGDRIVLKSGGPVMTVMKVTPADDENPEYIECAWFDDDADLQSSTFPPETLKEVG